MKTIFIPGFSIKNKAEMDHISGRLEANGHQVYRHSWDHWTDQEAKFDIAVEVAKLLDKTDGEYGIITKSIGGFVGVNLIKVASSKPKFAIFMGVGKNDLNENEQKLYSEVLSKVDFPFLFLHNKDDDHGSSAALREMLGDLECEIIEKPASDHRYDYPDDVADLVAVYTSSGSV